MIQYVGRDEKDFLVSIAVASSATFDLVHKHSNSFGPRAGGRLSEGKAVETAHVLVLVLVRPALAPMSSAPCEATAPLLPPSPPFPENPPFLLPPPPCEAARPLVSCQRTRPYPTFHWLAPLQQGMRRTPAPVTSPPSHTETKEKKERKRKDPKPLFA